MAEKGVVPRDGVVDEQVEHSSGSLEIFCSIAERLLHCLRRCLLGLLLVMIDQMNECVDQIIIDLAKSIIGETQQIKPCCPWRHTP